MEDEKEWCERVARTIDPDNSFLDECEKVVQWRKDILKNKNGE